MYYADDEIRRTDLELRCWYPELETEIYKKGMFCYEIRCVDYAGDFELLRKTFEQKIRKLASPVTLSQARPVEYEEKLEQIPFENPVQGFRASVSTKPEVRAFVEAKYSDVELIDIVHHPGADYTVDIFVGNKTDPETMKEMESFLKQVLGTDTIRVQKKERKEVSKELENEKESVVLDPFIPFLDNNSLGYHRELAYSAEEADYWFSNAEAIYGNQISRSDLPYFRDGQKNFFMDCSVSEDLDIRNALFLYDTVYLGMPMEKYLDSFLSYQRMTRKELIELVDMGKVVIVLTGAEKRYDAALLNEAYQATSLGVVGRRGANILMASYFSDLEKRYAGHFPGIYDCAKEMYRFSRKNQDNNLLMTADLISFPLRAKARSFEYLNKDGLLSLTAFGANTMLQEMLTDSLKETGDLDLFLGAYAGPLHLSMALNASYFPVSMLKEQGKNPGTDMCLAAIMEQMLSFYWYNKDQFAYLQESRNTKDLDQLKLFECEPSLSVLDVARSADDWHTPDLFGKILESIARLPVKKQNEKIREYNHLLFELAKLPSGTSVIDMIMTGAGYLPLPDGASTAMNVLDILRKVVSGQEDVKELAEKKELKKKLKKIDRKETSSEMVEDIYLLDKIYRVARLKSHS